MPSSERLLPPVVARALDRLQWTAPALSGVAQAAMVLAAVVLALVDLLVVGVSLGAANGYPGSFVLLSFGLPVAAVVAVAVRRSNLVLSLAALCSAAVGVTAAFGVRSVEGAPSLAVLFAVAVLSMVAVRVSSAPTALLVPVLGFVGVVAEALRLGGFVGQTALVACVVCYSIAVGVGVYLRWSDWRRVAAEEAARSDERLEIARELHDLVGHYVTGMVVQAQAAQHVADQNPAAAAIALGRIEAAGAEAMTAMRRMVGALRDDAPTLPGAAWTDIEELVTSAAAAGVPARLRMDPAVRELPADLSASAYRIVTESLTNIRRHARDATRVEVDLEREPTLLRIRVADDGTEVGSSGQGTYGLVGMSERADALGGSLYAGPGPTQGWLVLAELPLGRAS